MTKYGMSEFVFSRLPNSEFLNKIIIWYDKQAYLAKVEKRKTLDKWNLVIFGLVGALIAFISFSLWLAINKFISTAVFAGGTFFIFGLYTYINYKIETTDYGLDNIKTYFFTQLVYYPYLLKDLAMLCVDEKTVNFFNIITDNVMNKKDNNSYDTFILLLIYFEDYEYQAVLNKKRNEFLNSLDYDTVEEIEEDEYMGKINTPIKKKSHLTLVKN